MELESYVIKDEERVLVYRKEEPHDLHPNEEPDPCPYLEVSPDDPRLNEMIKINPEADAYDLLETLSIY